ncbi:MAG: DNA-binding transcriptional regulator [Thiothrix lacustris]|uniref:DNA-binding transcriptional regulator n=1 Tax=Thiothrix lacustris TaxID=525917 RepID=A0A1Y1QMR1_9GAMM|nr:MAG: DNA-binding transcriptional regulator [Thiothrix lacustris]
MRRADRLFQLVQILRNKRLVTARELAERLEVSERTIYRDIQDLSLSGVPVEGEAGVGYHLRYSLDIPPLMFTAAEIEALVVGARMLKAWGGSELGSSAQSVLDKVHAVIPAELHHHLQASRLYAMRFGVREDLETTLDTCRHSIAARRYLRLDYQRADHECSQRDVKPLGLFFWGNVWTLTAWCELRADFRTFRLDRIRWLVTLEQTFEELPGQRLADFLAMMQACTDDF